MFVIPLSEKNLSTEVLVANTNPEQMPVSQDSFLHHFETQWSLMDRREWYYPHCCFSFLMFCGYIPFLSSLMHVSYNPAVLLSFYPSYYTNKVKKLSWFPSHCKLEDESQRTTWSKRVNEDKLFEIGDLWPMVLARLQICYTSGGSLIINEEFIPTRGCYDSSTVYPWAGAPTGSNCCDSHAS